MEMRLDETVTGIRGDVAIKIFGNDLKTLEELGKRTLALVSSIPGAADPQMEVTSGVAELQVDVIRPALARYGLNVSDVQEVIETLVGGQPVSEMIDGQARFPISVRLPDNLRNDPDALKELVLRAPGGELVRLDQVAQVRIVRGPEVISRENARRRVAVQTNVRGTDLGSFVRLAQEKVNSAFKLPPGYEMEWGGQFENQSRANRRLAFVLPVSIAIHFCAAVCDVSFGQAGGAHPSQRALRIGGRHRGLWLRELESESIRFDRLHRPVWRRGAQRNRASELISTHCASEASQRGRPSAREPPTGCDPF